MYKFIRSIPSPYGNFKEGHKDPLTKVPPNVIQGWIETGFIEHCPLVELPPLPSEGGEEPTELPTSSESTRTSKDGKPPQQARTTYEKKRK